ncbi:GATA zinc finger domain-containing protein 1 [Lingula anatina]|uniref:GATA zinc finger domain-containing protein 1 n=1 Tax=Lingula anatina TaxID=7574 RepID=A0A1S3J661_LINAN|nr:GATA zinc finger domain-containing protein 1 [Lingula anatina]|eukprot:XP_013405736.1 GATA zinc finger domain-containing protein 1 [Lingula anatina]
MPFGVKPLCATCKTNTSTMWRKNSQGEVLCNSCGLKVLNGGKEVLLAGPGSVVSGTAGNGNMPVTSTERERETSTSSRTQVKEEKTSTSNNTGVRKSARIKPSKNRVQNSTKSLATKGKNRRVIFKKNPIKAAVSVATIVTSDYIFFKGMYWQVGDIVSLMDHGGGIYFAQIRGFLQDQFAQKSAVITWLLPTTESKKDEFDPATFILGPEEDLPRVLDCMDFICHAPSDYFRAKVAPYPTLPTKPDLGFIWTRVGPKITKLPTTDEIFSGTVETDDIHVKSET